MKFFHTSVHTSMITDFVGEQQGDNKCKKKLSDHPHDIELSCYQVLTECNSPWKSLRENARRSLWNCRSVGRAGPGSG